MKLNKLKALGPAHWHHLFPSISSAIFGRLEQLFEQKGILTKELEAVLAKAERPELLAELMSDPSEKARFLGEELISIFGSSDFPYGMEPGEESYKLWFHAYYVIEYMIHSKRSKFSHNFREEISKKNLIDKVNLIFEVFWLKIEAEDLASLVKGRTGRRNDDFDPEEISRKFQELGLRDMFHERLSRSQSLEEDIKSFVKSLSYYNISPKSHRMSPRIFSIGLWIKNNPGFKNLRTILIYSRTNLKASRISQESALSQKKVS